MVYFAPPPPPKNYKGVFTQILLGLDMNVYHEMDKCWSIRRLNEDRCNKFYLMEKMLLTKYLSFDILLPLRPSLFADT